ncbi:MAG: gamma carbonic anhydrase family protein [Myxococcaceae bacterium]|nr:gamma carbonic anhydrase family protein [Myxococcaceae bacterium]MCA3013435.1 gamma carbonic anhydrase family protein [Myxococcaceae bacterium]
MALTPFGALVPRIHPDAWVHPSAELLGDVTLEADVSIWPTCVARGDSGAIRFGARTNFQDGSIAHATRDVSTTSVGDECTIGHRVILHGCTVGHRVLVGMGSIVLDNVVIGDDCFVAAGSLLTPGKVFEPRSFILGSPAKRVREVTSMDLEWIAQSWRVYHELMTAYRSGASGPAR